MTRPDHDDLERSAELERRLDRDAEREPRPRRWLAPTTSPDWLARRAAFVDSVTKKPDGAP